MTKTPKDWSGLAYNPVPHSSNRIHADDIAKQYGFKGGLVPGVTLSAYFAHSAVEAWGEDWLSRGFAHVKINSPVYDGEHFSVAVQANDERYTAQLISENKVCADAEISLSTELPMAPTVQGDELLGDSGDRPAATREVMETLLENGCPAMEFQWRADHEMAIYLRDVERMPLILQTNPRNVAARGKANLSFLLGCANRHFAAVAVMSPWVHLETKSQNFQAVELNTHLISEMEILDLFNRKGHEFADCEFNLFDQASRHCVCSIWQRAIYQLRTWG